MNSYTIIYSYTISVNLMLICIELSKVGPNIPELSELFEVIILSF